MEEVWNRNRWHIRKNISGLWTQHICTWVKTWVSHFISSLGTTNCGMNLWEILCGIEKRQTGNREKFLQYRALFYSTWLLQYIYIYIYIATLQYMPQFYSIWHYFTGYGSVSHHIFLLFFVYKERLCIVPDILNVFINCQLL